MSPPPRRGLQRGVIVLPSAFTLGNLFLGIWAIVSAARGQFEAAAWMIVLAAVLDMLDGRVARFTRTSTDFGEQLDSLVDAVSFGVAPALIVYFLFFQEGPWSWLISFLYITAAIIRLARFNVEQAGRAKTSFHGLPSPTAGVTLASFYPFTQTAFFEQHLAGLAWDRLTTGLVVGVAVLMVSHVLYPVVPRFSVRTWKGRLTIVAALLAVTAALTVPALFFFPFALAYITLGLARSVALGFLDRLPERDPLIDEDDEEEREWEYEEMEPNRRSRRRAPSEPEHS